MYDRKQGKADNNNEATQGVAVRTVDGPAKGVGSTSAARQYNVRLQIRMNIAPELQDDDANREDPR